MFDIDLMRSRLEQMERIAEESLCDDTAFYEVLQALKWEINVDPRVQETVARVKAAGGSVFISFAPRVNIRVKTAGRSFSTRRRSEKVVVASSEILEPLAQELRTAASAVIRNSRCLQQLDALVTEVLAANRGFGQIVRQIERAAHKVLISIGVHSYVRVHQNSAVRLPASKLQASNKSDTGHGDTQPPLKLSNDDVAFLNRLKIRVDGN
jgi:hypothetical protein